MYYLFLLANAPDAWDSPHTQDDDGVYDDWGVYTQALQDAGILVEGAGLQAPTTATTVRVRDAQRLISDGPFVETKEHLVGYYVIDVPDLDTALDWAAQVPNARTGSVEVRPLTPGTRTVEMLATMAAAATAS